MQCLYTVLPLMLSSCFHINSKIKYVRYLSLVLLLIFPHWSPICIKLIHLYIPQGRLRCTVQAQILHILRSFSIVWPLDSLTGCKILGLQFFFSLTFLKILFCSRYLWCKAIFLPSFFCLEALTYFPLFEFY